MGKFDNKRVREQDYFEKYDMQKKTSKAKMVFKNTSLADLLTCFIITKKKSNQNWNEKCEASLCFIM